MEFYVYNLKEFSPATEHAEALLVIEIENAKKAGVKGIKIIHGYGSHLRGGIICARMKTFIPQLKKQGKIKDFIRGVDWHLGNEKTFAFIKSCPTAACDNDLNSHNTGVTVLLL